MQRGYKTDIQQKTTTETTIRVSQQQILDSELLKLSGDDLLQRVDNELNENGALEEGDITEHPDDEGDAYDNQVDEYDVNDSQDSDTGYDYDSEELPVYVNGNDAGEQREIPIGDTKSFVDDLKEQIADHEIADKKQYELVEYLIGSLNNNGFVDRPLGNISDDLLFHHNIDASIEDLEEALKILQTFDPPGIGARDLRECMLIQLRRKEEENGRKGKISESYILRLAEEIVDKHFDLFKRKEQRQIMNLMQIDADDLSEAMNVLVGLNPRPGLSLNEGAADRSQAVQPDFIVETTVDGDVTFYLRNDNVPPLRVSRAYREMLGNAKVGAMSASQQQDLKYIRENVERAQGFIDAIRRRHETLYKIMKAIIEAQKQFFITQDEATLKPLTGGEIAKMAHVDGSTVSRVVSNRYASVDGALYPLKSFFMRTKRNAEGEEVMPTEVEAAIRDIIDNEDRHSPLSDGAISDLLIGRGLNIKRRTVAKYRDQIGIPTANMRKEL